MTNMPKCHFVFDDSPLFAGFAYGSKWNGFDNVAVTPEEMVKIISHFSDSPETLEEFKSLEVGEDGLLCLGWGFATQIVEQPWDPYEDVLEALAHNDGAMLYWQMPNVNRAMAAFDAGIVELDENTDLLIHPKAIELVKGQLYEMPKTEDKQ
jgi:hypothetical protein